MNLLLCSSAAYKDTGYLTHIEAFIKTFLAKIDSKPKTALFIPYAGISRTHDVYLETVQALFKKFDIRLIGLHQVDNAEAAISNAEMIIVGGGNTFVLLKTLQKLKAIAAIQKRVQQGVPYISWSAGSNLAGKTISTTNDMPIVEPETFTSLTLVPFHINPHFISGKMAGHNGESREERLTEFMLMNPKETIVALKEGTALLRKNDQLELIGESEGCIFQHNQQRNLPIGDCSSLLSL